MNCLIYVRDGTLKKIFGSQIIDNSVDFVSSKQGSTTQLTGLNAPYGRQEGGDICGNNDNTQFTGLDGWNDVKKDFGDDNTQFAGLDKWNGVQGDVCDEAATGARNDIVDAFHAPIPKVQEDVHDGAATVAQNDIVDTFYAPIPKANDTLWRRHHSFVCCVPQHKRCITWVGVQVKVCDCLGMTVNLNVKGKVSLSQPDYIKKIHDYNFRST